MGDQPQTCCCCCCLHSSLFLDLLLYCYQYVPDSLSVSLSPICLSNDDGVIRQTLKRKTGSQPVRVVELTRYMLAVGPLMTRFIKARIPLWRVLYHTVGDFNPVTFRKARIGKPRVAFLQLKNIWKSNVSRSTDNCMPFRTFYQMNYYLLINSSAS